MEAVWLAERAALRCLARAHPNWTQAGLAATLGRSHVMRNELMPDSVQP
jgi:hypothetical protein